MTEAPSSEQLWLQQMGFEQVEPSDDLPEELVALRFWASDSAIMVTIDLSKSKESLSKSYQLLIELVLAKRARQAFNGILCSVS
ncbi:hypothetical protein JCM19238_5709 [Vibrio ponticus]|nr:hypothetical protein JCM19238_5709 [Vibrio ponticus]